MPCCIQLDESFQALRVRLEPDERECTRDIQRQLRAGCRTADDQHLQLPVALETDDLFALKRIVFEAFRSALRRGKTRRN